MRPPIRGRGQRRWGTASSSEQARLTPFPPATTPGPYRLHRRSPSPAESSLPRPTRGTPGPHSLPETGQRRGGTRGSSPGLQAAPAHYQKPYTKLKTHWLGFKRQIITIIKKTQLPPQSCFNSIPEARSASTNGVFARVPSHGRRSGRGAPPRPNALSAR